jgi:hypothetical protein
MENGFVGFTQKVIEGSVRRCGGFIVAEGYDTNSTIWWIVDFTFCAVLLVLI